MSQNARQQVVDSASIVVVKIGTRALTHADGSLDTSQVASIAGQIATLVAGGRKVVLVSSGAVGAGIGRLKLAQRPESLSQLQAAAAVGQGKLMECYNQALAEHGLCAGQVLLTADDLHDRRRYLNVRNTLLALFDYGAVPVVNENDTVRVDELARSVGDNDRLAAVVTNLLRAPLLVLLSDINGLYDRNPSDPGAQVIQEVAEISPEIRQLAGAASNTGLRLSTGGMASKLDAAQLAVDAGENVVIANGREPNVLTRILAGETVGTLFLASGDAVSSRKRWIGMTVRPVGQLRLDTGAVQAIAENGGSLLAVGIRQTVGQYDKGDVVALIGPDGEEIARGLTNYSCDEVQRIVGKSSDQFTELLGHRPYSEVIHRDNLTLLKP